MTAAQSQLETLDSTRTETQWPVMKCAAVCFWQDVAATFQKEGVVVAKPVYTPPTNLPESIQANREAYAQGEWRQQPYVPRQATGSINPLCSRCTAAGAI